MDFNWKEKLRHFVLNVWFLWGLCLLLDIITFFFILFKIHPGDKILALHYNVLLGVQWYGAGKNLYFLPAVALVISAGNFVLFRAFKHSEDFFAPLAIFASLCVQTVVLAAVLFLAKVN